MSLAKLFHVDGVRHSAVVLAASAEEVVELAIKASGSEEGDARVLFGGVGEWESPTATELKLPRGFELVETRS